jgi:hypothetical protein
MHSSNPRSSRRRLTVLLLLVLSAGGAIGQEDRLRQVFNNLAHDHIACAAYFTIGAQCAARSNQPELGKRLEVISDEIMKRAATYTKEAGLRDETILARFKLAINGMMRDMEKDCGNVSIVMAQHNDACEVITKAPDKRADELIKRSLRAP